MIAIVRTSLKRKFTSVQIMVNLIVMPLLLIVILGNALSSTFKDSSPASSHAGTSNLGVVDLDRSAASAALVTFLRDTAAFAVTTVPSPVAGETKLAADDIDVLATIPDGYGARLASGADPTVQLAAVDANVDHLRASQLAIDSLGDATRATVAAGGTTATPTAYAMWNYIGHGTSTAADPAAGLNGITYYTVTMIVLILIYGLSNTMNFVKEEYDGPLGDRYLASPTSKFSLVGAQVVSGTLTSVFQAAVIVVTARFAFDADLGKDPLVAGAIIVIAAALFNALGLVLGLLGRSRPWLDPAMSLLIPVMTFFGGGFVKLDFGGLQKLSINNFFQAALFREISGFTTQWNSLSMCVAVTGAALVASAYLVKGTGNR
ncbi:MAG: ABC transporter permease [Tetrasphaera sp.]|nr:ABC transporter permease [Tetrasphaera sp.]